MRKKLRQRKKEDTPNILTVRRMERIVARIVYLQGMPGIFVASLIVGFATLYDRGPGFYFEKIWPFLAISSPVVGLLLFRWWKRITRSPLKATLAAADYFEDSIRRHKYPLWISLLLLAFGIIGGFVVGVGGGWLMFAAGSGVLYYKCSRQNPKNLV